MLTKIKRFAQHYDVATWFVCHPKQIQNWTGAAPNLYDISGSAHFVNKADVGLVVHRVRDELAQQQNPGGQSNDKVREEVERRRREKKRERASSFVVRSLTLFFPRSPPPSSPPLSRYKSSCARFETRLLARLVSRKSRFGDSKIWGCCEQLVAFCS